MNDNRSPDAGQYTLVELLGAITIIGVALYVALPSVALPPVSGPAVDEGAMDVGFYRLEFDSPVDPSEVGALIRGHEDADLYDILIEPDGTVIYVGLWVVQSHDPEAVLPIFESLPQRPRSVEPCRMPDLSLQALHG